MTIAVLDHALPRYGVEELTDVEHVLHLRVLRWGQRVKDMLKGGEPCLGKVGTPFPVLLSSRGEWGCCAGPNNKCLGFRS